MYGNFSVVHIPPEQQGALSLGKDLPVQERMATDEMKNIIWQFGGWVDAYRSKLICDALKSDRRCKQIMHLNTFKYL